MSTVEPIAIIGIGCRFPGGVRSTDDLWKLLTGGRRRRQSKSPKNAGICRRYITRILLKPGRMNTRWGGFLDQIDQIRRAILRDQPARGRGGGSAATIVARSRL